MRHSSHSRSHFTEALSQDKSAAGIASTIGKWVSKAGEYIPTWEVLNTYGPDYKVIFVGDATMSPYEVTEVGGSVEHWNEEAGAVWFQRFLEKFSDIIWLNPESSERWPQTMSTQLIYRLINGRMFPMTLNGLDQAMGLLSKRQNAVLKPINLQ